MLHEPIHQQLARLGLRGAADALARLPLNDDLVDTLKAALGYLEAEFANTYAPTEFAELMAELLGELPEGPSRQRPKAPATAAPPAPTPAPMTAPTTIQIKTIVAM